MKPVRISLRADPRAFAGVERPKVDPVDTIVNDRPERPIATMGDKWPEIPTPKVVTTPVARLSAEILAECAAVKARKFNESRAAERQEERHTEGRVHRESPRNIHDD